MNRVDDARAQSIARIGQRGTASPGSDQQNDVGLLRNNSTPSFLANKNHILITASNNGTLVQAQEDGPGRKRPIDPASRFFRDSEIQFEYPRKRPRAVTIGENKFKDETDVNSDNTLTHQSSSNHPTTNTNSEEASSSASHSEDNNSANIELLNNEKQQSQVQQQQIPTDLQVLAWQSVLPIKRRSKLGARWCKNFLRLEGSANKFNRAWVTPEEDPQLYDWIYKQRQNCKRPDRRALLNKIGFEWKSSSGSNSPSDLPSNDGIEFDSINSNQKIKTKSPADYLRRTTKEATVEIVSGDNVAASFVRNEVFQAKGNIWNAIDAECFGNVIRESCQWEKEQKKPVFAAFSGTIVLKKFQIKRMIRDLDESPGLKKLLSIMEKMFPSCNWNFRIYAGERRSSQHNDSADYAVRALFSRSFGEGSIKEPHFLKVHFFQTSRNEDMTIKSKSQRCVLKYQTGGGNNSVFMTALGGGTSRTGNQNVPSYVPAWNGHTTNKSLPHAFMEHQTTASTDIKFTCVVDLPDNFDLEAAMDTMADIAKKNTTGAEKPVKLDPETKTYLHEQLRKRQDGPHENKVWSPKTEKILREAVAADDGSRGMIARLAKATGLEEFNEKQIQNKVTKLGLNKILGSKEVKWSPKTEKILREAVAADDGSRGMIARLAKATGLEEFNEQQINYKVGHLGLNKILGSKEVKWSPKTEKILREAVAADDGSRGMYARLAKATGLEGFNEQQINYKVGHLGLNKILGSKEVKWSPKTEKILREAVAADDGSRGMYARLAKATGLEGFEERQIKYKVGQLGLNKSSRSGSKKGLEGFDERQIKNKVTKLGLNKSGGRKEVTWSPDQVEALREAVAADDGSRGMYARLAKATGLEGFDERQIKNKVTKLGLNKSSRSGSKKKTT